ncbi:hypothetical protein ALC53_07635 [Atta colombica]|uniref:Uncharacterized protein n=1 Tax=Atta colombica TaxID=520822 RepID=A0A195BBD4_9HYME|nr:hypothetical protein ALC53_07635 [Atta colombica]
MVPRSGATIQKITAKLIKAPGRVVAVGIRILRRRTEVPLTTGASLRIVRQILKARPILLAGLAHTLEPISSRQCPLTLGESSLREYRSVVFGNNVAGSQTAYRPYYDMSPNEVSAIRQKENSNLTPLINAIMKIHAPS